MDYFFLPSAGIAFIFDYLLERMLFREKVTVIMPDHVMALNRIADNIANKPEVTKIVWIRYKAKTIEDVLKQLGEFVFSSDDRVFFSAIEYIGVHLAKQAKKYDVKVIMVEELSGVFCDFINQLNNYGERTGISVNECPVFVDEYWQLDSIYGVPNIINIDTNLEVDKYLQKEDFIIPFSKRLKSTFGITELPVCGNEIIDVWYAQEQFRIESKLERFLLEKTVSCFSELKIDYLVKPHPGESNYSKYEKFAKNVSINVQVPSEVYDLLERVEGEKQKKRVRVCYCGSGVILKEANWLRDENMEVILLWGLYEKLGIRNYGPNDMEKFYSHVKKAKGSLIHCPETFADLKRVLANIFGKTYSDTEYEEDLRREWSEECSWLLHRYSELLKYEPQVVFTTALMEKDDEGKYGITDSVRISKKEDYRYTFSLNPRYPENENYMWYIAGLQRVHVHVERVFYYNGDEKTQLGADGIKPQNLQKDDHDLWFFRDYDSCILLQIKDYCDKIEIEAKIEFVDTMRDIMLESREMIDGIQAELAGERTRLAAVDEVRVALEYRLTDCENEISNYKNELKDCRNQITSISDEKEALNKEMEYKKLVIENKDLEIAQKEREIENLNARITSLEENAWIKALMKVGAVKRE